MASQFLECQYSLKTGRRTGQQIKQKTKSKSSQTNEGQSGNNIQYSRLIKNPNYVTAAIMMFYLNTHTYSLLASIVFSPIQTRSCRHLRLTPTYSMQNEDISHAVLKPRPSSRQSHFLFFRRQKQTESISETLRMFSRPRQTLQITLTTRYLLVNRRRYLKV